jgi:hypothetical protein
MKNNSYIDRLTKDILKNSYLEVTDPDFNQTTIKRVLREDRRRRILQNILMCFFVFAAADTLILLAIWLLGLNIFDLIVNSGSISFELFSHINVLKDSILKNDFIKYIFLLLIVIAIVDGITEIKFKLLERKK